MFCEAMFNKDLSNWCPVNLKNIKSFMYNCTAPIPYWGKIADFQERQNTIEAYQCKKVLETSVNCTQLIEKVLKI